MTPKTGRNFVIALAGVLCLSLWPADGAAQSSAWKEARAAAVEAYQAGDYAMAEQNLLVAVDHAKNFGSRAVAKETTIDPILLVPSVTETKYPFSNF